MRRGYHIQALPAPLDRLNEEAFSSVQLSRRANGVRTFGLDSVAVR